MSAEDEVSFDGPWCTSTEVCSVCGHKQISVYPITCERLECAKCGHMNLAPRLDPAGERVRDMWRAIDEVTG